MLCLIHFEAFLTSGEHQCMLHCMLQIGGIDSIVGKQQFDSMSWSCGQMDKASDNESGDCRFESCQGHTFFFLTFMSCLIFACLKMYPAISR